jgi:hypothetical protein
MPKQEIMTEDLLTIWFFEKIFIMPVQEDLSGEPAVREI